jgi:FRG domain
MRAPRSKAVRPDAVGERHDAPAADSTMETITIDSWNAFVAATDELDGWAFRGHGSAELPLLSSLSRRLMLYCPDASQWREREARAMRIFRRKAHIYLGEEVALGDDLRCMAIMQHHGAPTRLLDFTKSPFVAAFFAVEGAIGDASIYALNTPALWRATPDFDPALTRDVIDPRKPEKFARYFAPNDRPLLWCGEPAEMDRRLVAQSGIFVVPGKIDLTLEQTLQYYRGPQPLMKKIVLPHALRERVMRTLYRMNITHATLFPDLDGLARSIGYELEVVWEGTRVDDDPDTKPR